MPCIALAAAVMLLKFENGRCMSHIRTFTLLLLLPVLLSSCGLFEEKKVKPRAQTDKTRYTAEEYIKHLALGSVDLSADPSVLPAANLDVVRKYNKQKKTKPENLTLLQVQYAPKNSKKNQLLLAPIGKKTRFGSLQDIMKELAANNFTVHNLQLMKANISPGASFSLPNDASAIAATLDGQQQAIARRAGRLSFIEEMQLQIDLISFFTENNFRDAGYLSVEDAKQRLAKASTDKSINPDIVHNLSQRLTAVESILHQKLPFSL